MADEPIKCLHCPATFWTEFAAETHRIYTSAMGRTVGHETARVAWLQPVTPTENGENRG